MNIPLRITEDELSHFLTAYYRKCVFPNNLSLGQSFALFYNLTNIPEVTSGSDSWALNIIVQRYVKKLS